MDVDLIASMLLLAGAASAHALGPAAPFAPPRAASVAHAEATAAAEPMAGLTGVRLGAAPQALIDGHWHRSGATVRGAVLQTITRDGITLRHPDGRAERLWLLPPPTHPQRVTP